MPSIAEFLGMWITINWNDHNPPHFHVRAGEYKGSIVIETGEILDGDLPVGKLKYLLKWTMLHRDELMENWYRARERKPLKKIQGL